MLYFFRMSIKGEYRAEGNIRIISEGKIEQQEI